ncbi:MAG: DUF4783 domain-containing protein [Bacteroidales bacterium]|nr:DUF4783 domain-containing protein [Bacteroidales bacterium]
MKIKGKFFAFAALLFLLVGFQQGKDGVKEDLVSTCSTGDLSFLDPYLQGFVVAHVPGSNGLTSAERCRSLLKDFFGKNVPDRFELRDTGMSGQNFFLIGTLHSGRKKWNLYFMLAPQKGKYQLQQIDIQNISL